MNKFVIVIIVVLIIILGGYFIWGKMYQSTSPAYQPLSEQTTPQLNVNPQPSTEQVPTTNNNIITYTNSGYSPNTLTIKVGETVTWKNQSSSGMWTASAMHPSHTKYSNTSLDEHCPDTANTSFDECKSAQPGESWSFTFQKKGTWGYHNHVKASDFGKIIVE